MNGVHIQTKGPIRHWNLQTDHFDAYHVSDLELTEFELLGAGGTIGNEVCTIVLLVFSLCIHPHISIIIYLTISVYIICENGYNCILEAYVAKKVLVQTTYYHNID